MAAQNLACAPSEMGQFRRQSFSKLTRNSLRQSLKPIQIGMLIGGMDFKVLNSSNWIRDLNVYVCSKENAKYLVGPGIVEYSLQKLVKANGGSHYVIIGKRVDGNSLHVFLTAEKPVVLTEAGFDLAEVEKEKKEAEHRETMRRSMRRASSAAALISMVSATMQDDDDALIMV